MTASSSITVGCESSSPVLPQNGVKISIEKKVRFGGIKTPQSLMPTGFPQSASKLVHNVGDPAGSRTTDNLVRTCRD